jgi:hypothetical protein
MHGEVAVTLLRHMGHSGTVPSALLAADVAAALARLKAAVAPLPPADPVDDRSTEPSVNLRQRAFPLIELLGRAASKGCDVTWDRA